MERAAKDGDAARKGSEETPQAPTAKENTQNNA